MDNFKEIADKVLKGEISGTFVLRNGRKKLSSALKINSEGLIHTFPYRLEGNGSLTEKGNVYHNQEHQMDVVEFIENKNMKVRIEYRYNNDNGYCRDFVCNESNMPKPGMKVRALVGYSTLVSIQQTRIDGDGLKHYVGLIKEDEGKSSNGQIYNI